MSEAIMPSTFEIKGWCPSAHRPMESGDGLLIRARSKRPTLTSAQLRDVAEIAVRCGNGLIDLTQRAQLQLRGVSEATLDEARERLRESGLFFPSEDDRVDILSNGYDEVRSPSAEIDALRQTLSRVREKEEALRALPPKFLVSIDTGGPISLTDALADISVEAIGAARAAICVAGAPNLGVIVAPDEIAPAVLKLMHAFAALRAERPFELRRMRQVVSAVGFDALLREACLTAQPYQWRAPTPLHSVLGEHPTQDFVSVGLAAPCGRWTAAQLAALANVAEAYGAGSAAPTHLRLFLVNARDGARADEILDAARALDLIVSADDPRLAVVACPGAPECSQARGETRAALARLGPLAQKIAGKDGVGLHVSGCAKGCARAQAAPITLVADNGRFDLVEKGCAGDTPAMRGLDIEAVENALERAKEVTCPTP
jgi:precorrin-3B synthase